MTGPDGPDRSTFVPFAPEEIAAIRTQLRGGALRVCCPRCDAALDSSLPLGAGGSVAAVWELRCEPCRKTMLVRDPEGL